MDHYQDYYSTVVIAIANMTIESRQLKYYCDHNSNNYIDYFIDTTTPT